MLYVGLATGISQVELIGVCELLRVVAGTTGVWVADIGLGVFVIFVAGATGVQVAVTGDGLVVTVLLIGVSRRVSLDAVPTENSMVWVPWFAALLTLALIHNLSPELTVNGDPGDHVAVPIPAVERDEPVANTETRVPEELYRQI